MEEKITDENRNMDARPVATGIKSWSKDDQPQEKLLLKGIDALSNAELLAILIRTGNKQHSALGLAQHLLTSVNNDLQLLSRLNVKDFMKIKGLGKVKAITVIAALELGRRRHSEMPARKKGIRTSKEAAAFLQPLLADHAHEVFSVMFLSQSNRLLHYEVISTGGMTSTIVDPKIIMKKALEHQAVNMILCHNHPSGNLEPSSEDKKLTQKISDAAALLDMKVLDHVIVSSLGFFSFADDGLLP